MNERIKELAEQAGASRRAGVGGLVFRDSELEKFAELIVRECEKSIKSVPTHFEAQDKIIVECLKSIRETFQS